MSRLSSVHVLDRRFTIDTIYYVTGTGNLVDWKLGSEKWQNGGRINEQRPTLYRPIIAAVTSVECDSEKAQHAI